jgi:hypothetical protein
MGATNRLPLQTEFEFTLPKGYVDADGNLHRAGTMRLATALDEIAPLRDPRVRANQGYLAIVILARVITRLGELPDVNTNVVENLFAADLAYLQDLYQRINSDGATRVKATCPHCHETFEMEPAGLGES